MADETVEVVRSVSSGLVGRARSTTRDATPLVLDSSGRPQPDAFTNTEAFLAGGLTPANVAQAIQVARPWAVDVSSGVESNKLKDPALVRAFISEVRRVDDDRG